MKFHAGRYSSMKNAESYADYLRGKGDKVIIEYVTVYDVFVVKDHRIGGVKVKENV